MTALARDAVLPLVDLQRAIDDPLWGRRGSRALEANLQGEYAQVVERAWLLGALVGNPAVR